MNRKKNTLYLSPDQEIRQSAPQTDNPAQTSDWVMGTDAAAPQAPARKPEQEEAVEPVSFSASEKDGALSVRDTMTRMAQLIANITESYTVAIFLADSEQRALRPAGYQTLSREFLPGVEIGFGSGLVGWTAENKVRISVCPFERDASTLLYYGSDQDLKSFIAVPIIADAGSPSERLLGVIACDSKKSYAYAKLTEKILLECAAQTAVLIGLFDQLGASREDNSQDMRQGAMAGIIESLRNHSEEETLLTEVARLPQDLVERDALVVVTTAEGGVGAGRFYPPAAQSGVEHRLWEMVCKHKKVISGRKSVHALPIDDIKQRSFLSIPFRVLDREAGSLNLLSRPKAAFTPSEISSLERIAEVVGLEVERLRLRESARAGSPVDGILPWKLFCVKAKSRLLNARAQRMKHDLVRLSFGGMLAELEQSVGIAVAAAVSARIARLIDQLVQPNAVACALYDADYLLLTDAGESRVLLSRLERLLARLAIQDFTKDRLLSDVDLGAFIRKNWGVVIANYPQHGETVDQLVEHCRRAKKVGQTGEHQAMGEVAHAGNWQ